MSMRTVIAIAAIAACLAGALRAPAAQPPALPPGTVGYLWVPSPEKLFADADSFLGALGTPNAGLMFVKSLLGQMLSNPDLSAVDMKGPLLLVMLNPKENPQPLAAAFRIGQLDAYLKGLEEPPILKPSDAASGVKVVLDPGQTHRHVDLSVRAHRQALGHQLRDAALGQADPCGEGGLGLGAVEFSHFRPLTLAGQCAALPRIRIGPGGTAAFPILPD